MSSPMRAKCTINLNKCSIIFGHFHKIAKSDYFILHVCLSVWNTCSVTARIFVKFDLSVFGKSVEKIQL